MSNKSGGPISDYVDPYQPKMVAQLRHVLGWTEKPQVVLDALACTSKYIFKSPQLKPNNYNPVSLHKIFIELRHRKSGDTAVRVLWSFPHAKNKQTTTYG